MIIPAHSPALAIPLIPNSLSLESGHFQRVFEYQLTNLLGEGIGGRVFRASNLIDGSEVAIKLIKKNGLSITSWKRDRTTNSTIPSEIFMLKRLSHPNIVKFINYLEDEENFYLVMELLGSDTGTVSSVFPVEELTRENIEHNIGSFSAPVQLHTPDSTPPRPYGRLSSDLYSFIQTSNQYSSPPSEQVIRIIVAQLTEAILFLHANGYVHRDIKDENIMVDSNYKVTLIDLGAADRIPSTRDEYFTSFRGTFRYHPPELFTHPAHRGTEVDIYCFGVVIFTLFYSSNPFLSKKDILNQTFNPLVDMNRRSDNARDFVLQMLNRDPALRPTISQVKMHPFLQNSC